MLQLADYVDNKKPIKTITSQHRFHANVKLITSYWINDPTSMKNMMISLRRVTFLKNNWRLNFASCWTSFSSFGSSTRIAALIGFQAAVNSSWICGETPLARVVRFLSFNAYHRFSPFRMRSNGMTTRPRNSTLWSRSSSKTVTSSTEDMSFTLLCCEGEKTRRL